MPTTTIQKKCWNCKEAVHSYASSCPYCGADVSTPPAAGAEGSNGPLAPPYRLVNSTQQEDMAPPSPFASSPRLYPTDEVWENSQEGSERGAPSGKEALHANLNSTNGSKASMTQVIAPMTMLLSGAVFFMFGLVLLMYSQDGVFTLHWNGNRWPYFLFPSLALLFFGWKSAKKLKDSDDESD